MGFVSGVASGSDFACGYLTGVCWCLHDGAVVLLLADVVGVVVAV